MTTETILPALPEPLCNLPGHCRDAIEAYTKQAIREHAVLQSPEVAAWKRDADRYRWLTDDHEDRETRLACRDIQARMGVKSYSAVSADIDAAMEGSHAGAKDMTVKMPKPVAWMLAYQTISGGIGWKLSWTRSGAGVCNRLPGESREKSLITTDQAEAYANARVREALEESSDLLEQAFMEELKSRIPGEDLDEADEQFNAFHGARAFGVSRAQQIIRALIPQEGK